MQQFLNNFKSVFLDAVTNGATQIRITRLPGGALDTPLANGDFYVLTAYRIVNEREVDHEVMHATAVVANEPGSYTVTVQRAQEHVGSSGASTAYAYGVGDHIEARFTARAAQTMLQSDDNLRTIEDPDAALENLGASSIGMQVLKAATQAQARAAIGAGTGEGGGSGTVDVASNGALVAGGETVAPAYLGVRTSSQITAIHAAISAGTASYPTGSTLITEAGEVMTLRGVGTAARFTISTPSEVDVSPIRTGNFSVTQADSGTSIPVSGTASTTLNTGLTGFMCAFQREDTATFTLTAGSGVTFRRIVDGVSTVVSSITATQQGQYVLVRPAAAANEYYVSVGG